MRPRLLRLLAEVLDRDVGALEKLSDGESLFAGGLGLDSLTGVQLLTAIEREFGVDIAEEDLALECLESVGTLTRYLEDHRVQRL